MLAVPMVLLNAHSGLMFAHCFAKKTWMTDALFAEILLRGVGSLRSLLGCEELGSVCASAADLAGPDGTAFFQNRSCGGVTEAGRWQRAVLEQVEVISLASSWALDKGRMTPECARVLDRRLQGESQFWMRQGKRRIGGPMIKR
eukprot:Hpha_TRINITY_DN4255_c0_g1::TRINITY_DN4255_c0_g1_i1::g.186683::m.186683